MPKAYIRSYNEFLDVDHKWKWLDDLNLKLSVGTECFFTHGMSADGLNLAMQYGKNVCQFHFHSKFNLKVYAFVSSFFNLAKACTKQYLSLCSILFLL